MKIPPKKSTVEAEGWGADPAVPGTRLDRRRWRALHAPWHRDPHRPELSITQEG